MLIVKAGKLNITRGLILIARNTMEQRRIPAKETSVHSEIRGISTLLDAHTLGLESTLQPIPSPTAKINASAPRA